MITLKGALTSGVFGVADIGLEYWDAKDARVKPFYRATDWLRVGGVAGGIVIDKMGYKVGRTMSEVGAPLFYASLPLLEKSVKDLVAPTIGLRAKQALKAGAGAGVRLGAAQGVSYARNPITPVAANGARAL